MMRRMGGRVAAGLIAVLVAAPGLGAEAQRENPPGGEPEGRREIRILVPQTTAAIPLLVLAEEGRVPGLRVRAELFINHAQALVLLVRGEADLLVTGTSQGWENYQGGGPVALVNTGNWGISSLVGRDESIRTFADLAGKRIALPFPGAPLDFQTRYLLDREGVDPDRDVRISYAASAQAVALLAQGQIDAAPLPEPLATLMVRAQGFARLIEYTQAWARVHNGDGRSPQVSAFATRALCGSDPQVLRRIEEAWRQASEEVSADPAPYARRFAEALAVPPEVLEEAIRRTTYWVPPAEENRRRVVEYYREVQRFLAGTPPPLAEEFFCQPRQ
jgi:NitT/TauT family transport system substrate-binding protein